MRKNECVKKIREVEFPQFSGININMMPFIMGQPESIPEEYAAYRDLVDSCCIGKSDKNKIGYLSISESIVEPMKSQRRGGVHTESTLRGSWGAGPWGTGSPKPFIQGGLYMASTLPDSCKVWDCEVSPVNSHGSIDSLHPEYEKIKSSDSFNMKANNIYWLTDKVPHESLKIKEKSQRQFFRLVTNDIFGWFSQHSTANRLGIMPDCPVITYNKFLT